MNTNDNEEKFAIAALMNLPVIILIIDVLFREQSEYYLFTSAIVLTIILFSMSMWLVYDFETVLIGNMLGILTTLLPNLLTLVFVTKFDLNEYVYLITPLIYFCLYIFLRNKEITNKRYRKIDMDYKMQNLIKDLNISSPITNREYLNIVSLKESKEYKCSVEYINLKYNDNREREKQEVEQIKKNLSAGKQN